MSNTYEETQAHLDAVEELASEAEYQSVEDFLEYCMDDERKVFNHVELRALALNTKTSGSKVRAELEAYGLSLGSRPNVKKTRGFSTNSNDRYYGAGSCQAHGGSGKDQILGFAGRRG
jgi:hypothetical protein